MKSVCEQSAQFRADMSEGRGTETEEQRESQMSRLYNLNMLVAAVGVFGKGAICHTYTQLAEIVVAEKNKLNKRGRNCTGNRCGDHKTSLIIIFIMS